MIGNLVSAWACSMSYLEDHIDALWITAIIAQAVTGILVIIHH